MFSAQNRGVERIILYIGDHSVGMYADIANLNNRRLSLQCTILTNHRDSHYSIMHEMTSQQSQFFSSYELSDPVIFYYQVRTGLMAEPFFISASAFSNSSAWTHISRSSIQQYQ